MRDKLLLAKAAKLRVVKLTPLVERPVFVFVLERGMCFVVTREVLAQVSNHLIRIILRVLRVV